MILYDFSYDIFLEKFITLYKCKRKTGSDAKCLKRGHIEHIFKC